MAKPENSFLRWLSKPEAMVGLSAVVVSLVAVAVSAYEARVMREWQRAAVWPYVQLSRSYFYDPQKFAETGERSWRLELSADNVGVGPAQVKDFIVTVDDEPYPDWGAAMRALLGDEVEINYGQSSINGAIIPAGKKITMFQLSDDTIAPELYRIMDRLDYEACFCSVFGECWRTSYREFGGSRSVKSCSQSDASFRE